MATLSLLKINVFWKVITSVHDITNKILLGESNYIVDVIMWPKFGNSGISMRKVVITMISCDKLKGFDQKNQILWGVILVQVQ